MRKCCNNCKKSYPEEHAFCPSCGTSFDAKYCPKLHQNDLRAIYCHVCGSSDLSTPHDQPTRIALTLLIVTVLAYAGAIWVGTIIMLSLFWEKPDTFKGKALVTVGAAFATVCWAQYKNRK